MVFSQSHIRSRYRPVQKTLATPRTSLSVGFSTLDLQNPILLDKRRQHMGFFSTLLAVAIIYI